MSAPADLELGGEEEYPVGESVRYFYSRGEYEALEREKIALQERLKQVEADRRRRSWWGKLRALLPGGNHS